MSLNLDIEHGNFTRVHNLLLEALAGAPITDRERRVMIAVARLTYGYGKAKAVLDPFDVARITRLHVPHTKATMARLLASGLLVQEGDEIGIQKYFDRWEVDVKPRGREGGRKTPTVNGEQLSLFEDPKQFDLSPNNLFEPQTNCLESNKPDNNLLSNLFDSQGEGWLPAPGFGPLKKEKKEKMIMDPHEYELGSREEPMVSADNLSNVNDKVEGFHVFMAKYNAHAKRAVASQRDISALKAMMAALQIDGYRSHTYLERYLAECVERGKDKVIPHPNYLLPVFQGYVTDAVREAEKHEAKQAKKASNKQGIAKRYAGYL